MEIFPEHLLWGSWKTQTGWCSYLAGLCPAQLCTSIVSLHGCQRNKSFTCAYLSWDHIFSILEVFFIQWWQESKDYHQALVPCCEALLQGLRWPVCALTPQRSDTGEACVAISALGRLTSPGPVRVFSLSRLLSLSSPLQTDGFITQAASSPVTSAPVFRKKRTGPP